jgi:hypothetical protein
LAAFLDAFLPPSTFYSSFFSSLALLSYGNPAIIASNSASSFAFYSFFESFFVYSISKLNINNLNITIYNTPKYH